MPMVKSKSKITIPHSQDAGKGVKDRKWPAIESSKKSLELNIVVPEQIVTVPNFWDKAMCKKYVSYLRTLPLTTTPGKPKRGDAVRVNDRFQCEDEAFAEELWSRTGLRDLILAAAPPQVGDEKSTELITAKSAPIDMWGGNVLGLSSNIRIYRYSKGQFFDKHSWRDKNDASNSIHHPGDARALARTTWTLLLYLTSVADGCIGGETVFYPDQGPGSGKKNKGQTASPDPIVVSPETGMLLLHRHGAQCLLHEGREVTEGEKWIIRTDLCVRR